MFARRILLTSLVAVAIGVLLASIPAAAQTAPGNDKPLPDQASNAPPFQCCNNGVPRIVAVTVFGTGGTDNPALASATSFDGDVDGDEVSTVTFATPFNSRPHVALTIHGTGDGFAHQLHVQNLTASQVTVLISEAGQFAAFSENYELIAIGE